MIVVFGSLNLDIFFRCERLPATGETLLCNEGETAPGGKGANQALAAARDGARVHMVGAVGHDAFAEEAQRLLAKESVDLSALARCARPTGCATIAVLPSGDNAIVVGSGANQEVRAAQVPDALLTPGVWLLLQMEVPLEENWALIDRAKKRGARVLLNLAPAGPVPADALDGTDLLVVNEVEAKQLLSARGGQGDLRQGLAAIAAKHRLTAVMTLGARGLEAVTAEGESIALPAPTVAVVDTTAAGDCFCGVLAAGLHRELPLRAALARALAAASLSCTRAGAQTSLPRSDEIDRALAKSDGE
jgi:ribokinase